MTNQLNKLPPFITIPRSIARDFKDGKLNRNEWALYMWMRTNADPYGNYTASIPALRDDIFKRISENYVNKLLLSLRDKNYIQFQNHQGRRGSFEVSFGDFLTPDHTITSLANNKNTKIITSQITAQSPTKIEASQNSYPLSQKLKEEKERLRSKFSFGDSLPEVRPHYNDNHKENDN